MGFARSSILFLCVAAFAPLSMTAHANPAKEAGRVEMVSSPDPNHLFVTDGYILRNGQKRALKIKQHLYPGDSIYVLVPNMYVQYSLVGQEELPKPVSKANSPQIVSEQASLKPLVCKMLPCDVAQAIAERSKWTPIPRRTQAHGDIPEEIKATTILPEGEQYLPVGSMLVAPVWRPEGGVVKAGERSVLSQRAFGILDGPFLSDFILSVEGEGGSVLHWQVRLTSSPPPLPPNVPPGTTIAEDGDRLARALFLLQEQNPKWHLFALSEIADLAPHSSTADIIWRQIVTTGSVH